MEGAERGVCYLHLSQYCNHDEVPLVKIQSCFVYLIVGEDTGKQKVLNMCVGYMSPRRKKEGRSLQEGPFTFFIFVGTGV